MLLWLADFLKGYMSFFNVFQYLTLRGILGVLTALAIAFIVGPIMIRKLSYHQIGQSVSDLINWFADCNRRLGLSPKPRTG